LPNRRTSGKSASDPTISQAITEPSAMEAETTRVPTGFEGKWSRLVLAQATKDRCSDGERARA
jgi:hypothetical protein